MTPALAQQIKLTPKPPLRKEVVPLARQIASRTTDLIAAGVVLIGGLTIGKSVVEWWRAEPPSVSPTTALPSPAWGTDQSPLQLEFGDARLALTRQIVAGDATTARTRLVELCRQITQTVQNTPTEAASPAENELLAKTAGLDPVAGVPANWAVYRLGEQFSLTVGVRWTDSSEPVHASLSSSNRKSKIENPKSPLPSPRLVCWGLAFPQADDRWMLSVFTAASVAPTSAGDWPDVQVPPGARRSLALRDERGAGLIGFSGTSDPAAWYEFFNDNLQKSGWRAPAGWQQTHNRSSARFVSQTRPDAGTIEIQFSSNHDNQLTGLIQFLPGQNEISASMSVD